MSRRGLPWAPAAILAACVAPGAGAGEGPRGALLAVSMRETFGQARSEPLPGFAERVDRLGRERSGLELAVVVGAFSPIVSAQRSSDPSWPASRRLPQERAEAVAARLRAAGCRVRVVVVTDDPGRDGRLEIFAGAPR